MRTLDRLLEEYPLPSGFAPLTTFAETTSIEGVAIHLAGFSTQSDSGQVVTGSAASLSELPVDRAYFELLERLSVVLVKDNPTAERPIRDTRGVTSGYADWAMLSPTSADPGRWRYALSNGVAAGPTWTDACERALGELVERDRVLRSWYGHLDPIALSLPSRIVPAGLEVHHSFEAYSFDEPELGTATSVVGVFGFPKDDDAPLVYGFGARERRSDALKSALDECIQRLGFLWGEGIPSTRPVCVPTPDFHQETFLWPPAHSRVRQWLAGDNRKMRAALVPPVWREAPRAFIDLTPNHLSQRLFVAKALPQREVPLVFGLGHPHVSGHLAADLEIHPIA